MDSYRLTYTDEHSILVRFSLEGTHLNPTTITQVLGIAPATAWKRGDLRHGSTTLPPYTFGLWSIHAPCSSQEPFERQLTLLLDILESIMPVLHPFLAMYSSGISVASSFGRYQLGFHLDVDTLRRIAAMGLSLDFDLYPVLSHEASSE